MSTKRIAVLVLVVAVGVLAGTAVAQGPPDNAGPTDNAGPPDDVDAGPPDDVDAGPPDDVDAGPPDDVDAGPPEDVTTGPPENVTRGPSDNVTVGPPEGVSEFVGTSPLAGPDKVDPVSLSGKIRVESQYLENTTAELVRNSSTDFTLDLTVTGNATNVTFFLNKQAVEASQNISNVTMEVDGEPAEFGVNESGGENWIVFEIEEFSTRTVAFVEAAADGGDAPTLDPLPGFDSPPANTGEVHTDLIEDVNGDGDGTDPTQTVLLWSELVVNSQDFDDLTQEQVDALDWNGDGQLTPADAVSLWTEQVLA